ncbi:MAG: PaaI family thioesterase [Firmicutes bacterium]|nr:PaaI family thioesterase [Bacillota bacterium]
MERQKQMEEYLEKTMYENNVKQEQTVNGMMKSIKIGCSSHENSITLGFPVQEWQANRGGMMHGGIICTAFDITAAAVARFCAGENYAPTISLDVKYIRPVQVGDTLLVTAKATAAGRRITQIVCQAESKTTGKLAATAATVYMNVDTTKEKR